MIKYIIALTRYKYHPIKDNPMIIQSNSFKLNQNKLLFISHFTTLRQQQTSLHFTTLRKLHFTSLHFTNNKLQFTSLTSPTTNFTSQHFANNKLHFNNKQQTTNSNNK
ncbi:hypothetical protein Glove_23g175 [Diversispora epigaea]|uniref:Uncharacterized protein n=1 Tax=Diversispora epigaea TaxID=1348612 RepID=A0A397JTY6_9GLOM|nr:hypothetical protein Glove_23g175 [Diversispora epigaea]